MAERTSRKIPVTERQFLWVQDDDKGEVILHVGPTMVSPTAADRIVVDNGDGGFREDYSAPQRMIALSDSQYAVLYNPLLENDGGPNGRFKVGRNESRQLKNGTRSMIPGPCSFYLRPGQRAEVRDAHELASDQYLVVKVYGEVDKAAPFFEITAKSAAFTKATAEKLGVSRSSLSETPLNELKRGQLVVIRGLDTQFYIPPTGVDIVPDTSIDDTGTAASAAAALALLQKTPAPASKATALASMVTGNAGFVPPPPPAAAPAAPPMLPIQNVAPRPSAPPPKMPAPAKPAPRPSNEPVTRGYAQEKGRFDALEEESERFQDDLDLADDEATDWTGGEAPEQSVRKQRRVESYGKVVREKAKKEVYDRRQDEKPRAAFETESPAPEPVRAEPSPKEDASVDLLQAASMETVRRALEKEARQARLVRRAVVLGEKEYCVIIDADGKREIKVGPARVFPGPYDTFMTKGSRRRVYDAYELLPQRALWLRIISAISRAELEKKLPRGFALDPKDTFFPGDELLLTGVSTFFFPFNEIEVLSPATGEAVVGNDHSRVFIEAIGIDQRSGIYVRDLSTGEVRLVRGKLSYLVDPRKEIQVTRTIPARDWNLWVASLAPHKYVDREKVLYWALSITVPHNMAVLATSAAGQRVIEGPKMALLEYEEKLTTLLLSTGTPKTDDAPLETCYLRVRGNRVSDEMELETSDFVKLRARVSYSVSFRPEYKDRWFTHENYIQWMVEHLRSLVRSRIRGRSLTEAWSLLPSLIRDSILGERQADGSRGRLFAENGMEVTEVEVLSSEIEDGRISELMQKVQTESVMLQLGDRQAQESLSSAKLRAEVERQSQELAAAQKERDAKLQELVRRLAFDGSLLDARNQEALAKERQALALSREQEALSQRLANERAAKSQERDLMTQEVAAKTEAARAINQAELEKAQKLAALEKLLLQAKSAATVAERQAVQAGLVEAMAGLGDKLMLGEVAKNMNLVSLFQGKDVGQILSEVVRGTKLHPAIEALRKLSDSGSDS